MKTAHTLYRTSKAILNSIQAWYGMFWIINILEGRRWILYIACITILLLLMKWFGSVRFWYIIHNIVYMPAILSSLNSIKEITCIKQSLLLYFSISIWRFSHMPLWIAAFALHSSSPQYRVWLHEYSRYINHHKQ